MAWTSLTVQERREILSLFPDMAHTLDADTDDARPNLETLMNDDSFRHDCATYVENLANGRHDPGWLEQAWRAHERRKAGEFDGWLRDRFVQDWGVEIPEDTDTKTKVKQLPTQPTPEEDVEGDVGHVPNVGEEEDEEEDEQQPGDKTTQCHGNNDDDDAASTIFVRVDYNHLDETAGSGSAGFVGDD
jgi:hypothetical protein